MIEQKKKWIDKDNPYQINMTVLFFFWGGQE